MAVTTPKQARARETFDRVLDAAAELLVDKGIEGLNTNEVARLAGVNIATLYRYFDDKYDLVDGLLSRYSQLQVAKISEQMQQFDDPRERLNHILVLQLELMEQHPWLGAVNIALRASPQLKEVRERNRAYMRDMVLGQLGEGAANLRSPINLGERQKAAARLSTEIWGTGLTTIAEAPVAERPALMTEFKILLNAYLDTMSAD